MKKAVILSILFSGISTILNCSDKDIEKGLMMKEQQNYQSDDASRADEKQASEAAEKCNFFKEKFKQIKSKISNKAATNLSLITLTLLSGIVHNTLHNQNADIATESVLGMSLASKTKHLNPLLTSLGYFGAGVGLSLLDTAILEPYTDNKFRLNTNLAMYWALLYTLYNAVNKNCDNQ